MCTRGVLYCSRSNVRAPTHAPLKHAMSPCSLVGVPVHKMHYSMQRTPMQVQSTPETYGRAGESCYPYTCIQGIWEYCDAEIATHCRSDVRQARRVAEVGSKTTSSSAAGTQAREISWARI